MRHKALLMGHPVRLELTREGMLAKHYTTRGAQLVWFIVIYLAFFSQMWHKALLMVHPVRLKLILEGLLS